MPLSANEKYIRNEEVLIARRQNTFQITLSNKKSEYLQECCNAIENKYGFYPSRKQQAEMIEKLFMVYYKEKPSPARYKG